MVFAASNTGLPLSTDITTRGVSFNFSYAPGTRQEVIDGFERAGRFWSSQLADTYFDKDTFSNRSTEINIYVKFSSLANDAALGGARPGMVRVDYKKFLTAAFQDLSSTDDWTAFRNLQFNGSDKGFAEDILAGFGVNKYNTDLQNRQILTNLGLAVRSDLSIQAQSQALFNQLTPNHLARFNRDTVQFDSDQFTMLVSPTNQTKFSFKVGQGQSTASGAVVDNNGNDNNKKIWLTRANAKALNLLDGADKAFDGEITLSDAMLGNKNEILSFSQWLSGRPGSTWNATESIWDFSRIYSDTTTVAANKFDFLSVAQHEIGHILGFTSGTDAFGMLNSLAAESGTTILEEKDIAYTATMDLFRYSDTSRQQNVFDWSTGTGEKYFSIDGGRTRLANFATGAGDDDFQGSHWANQPTTPLGIMNPTLNRGQILQISNLDLQLLDVIGWDRTTRVLNNREGVDIGTSAAGSQLSNKVREIGLNWNALEQLLTRPAAELLTQLTQERTAIAPFQQVKLQADLQTNQTQLSTEQAALKVQQDQVSAQLSTAQRNLSTQLSTLSNLQKSITDLQKTLQDVQSKISSQQTALLTATSSKRTSIQAEIAKLETQRSSLQSQLQAVQTQFSNQQPVVSVAQNQVNRLQTQLASLQTTPSIEALRVRVTELQNLLRVLSSLEGGALKLGGEASTSTIKAELDNLKSSLSSKLSSLTALGDGSRRAQEEQKVLEQVVKLAQEQEALWNQLVANHELALFPGARSQTMTWLSETPEQLKVRIETASRRQLASLLQLVDQDQSAQGQIWAAKVQQATMLLAQVDAKTAEKVWRQAAKELPKLLENSGPDNPLTGTRSTSGSTTFRFWQTANPNYLSDSSYSTVGTYVEGVENADLNMRFYASNSDVIEPKTFPAENTFNPWQQEFGDIDESQSMVKQVVKLALEQEHLWIQPIASHELTLFPTFRSQTTSWLSGTSEQLKLHLETASPHQFTVPLQPVDQSTSEQGQIWTTKVRYATKLTAQADAKTTKKIGRQMTKELTELLEDANSEHPDLVS